MGSKTSRSGAAASHGRPARVLDTGHYVPGLVNWVSNRLSSTASWEYRQRFGIGIVEWRVLTHLAIEPWATGARICSAIGLDKAAVSRSFSVLEKSGLILVRSGEGRRKEAALTVKGAALHEQILARALERENTLLRGFSSAERATLIGFLHRLLRNLGSHGM